MSPYSSAQWHLETSRIFPSAGVSGKTRIKVRLDHVEKKVVVPNEHLKTLVDTYRLLHAKALPTTSKASAMKVRTTEVILADLAMFLIVPASLD